VPKRIERTNPLLVGLDDEGQKKMKLEVWGQSCDPEDMEVL
jgi:hypothetical protein